MTALVADAYDRSALAWRAGPEAVYARLATALLAHAPGPVVGRRVLDVGAGTGVAARAALAAGAGTVVAVDVAVEMLRQRGPDLGAVGADAQRLPFDDGSFDLAVAAFCLGHLPDPAVALAEIRRVAGRVVASAFAPGWTHPAKTLVDEVMAGHGFVAPAWYSRVKAETEPVVNDPIALAALARTAGFTDVRVQQVEVDSGLDSAAEVVGWRFGMAHLAPFVASLDVHALDRARVEAERAVAGAGPVVIGMLALSAS